ncbi:hypothetical protein M3Y99_00300200 [Aphelenchoides fujianensis]|nr:hypothetical protein M3Y99_00300200 [Aphelenchoides fujianensis]
MMDDQRRNDDLRRKRIEGLEEKRRFEEQRRRLISESLKKIDSGKPPNKRIVFRDSDDEDSDEGDAETARPTNGKLALFQDDADPQLEEQAPESLLQNRLTGAKSAKLMALESRFGHDQRFRVDDRFLDSDGEEEAADEGKSEIVAEKKSAMAILSKVIGRHVKSAVIERKAEKRVVRPFQRFDPDDPEHVAWMEANQPAPAAKNKQAISAEAFNNEVDKAGTIVKEGQFYEMDDEFAKDLLQKSNGGQKRKKPETFSFLSAIGRSVEPKSEPTGLPPKEEAEDEPPQKKRKRMDVPADERESKESKPEMPAFDPARPLFAVDTKDRKFLTDLHHFANRQKPAVVRAWFEKQRATFIAQYKMLSKRAARQKEQQKSRPKAKRPSAP